MNLFDLYAKITLDDGEYQAKLDENADRTNKFAAAIGSGVQAASKLAKVGAVAGTAAFVALGKSAFEYNKEMESYTTNFAVMLGDQEKAAEKVNELKELGAKTPFEMGDLAAATQTLLAFNVSSEESTGVLTKLGDISLGNTQKLESLTRAYGKMNASQKVTLEDINMMIDAGFNPLLSISEQTGESMTDLYARVSKGGVAFEEIQAAIESATAEGGQFYQGMEQASKTTEGMISTLKDNVQALIGEVFTPITEGISKQVLPAAIDGIDKLTTAFHEDGVEGMAEAGGEIIGSAIASIALGLIEGVPKVLSNIPTVVRSIVEGFMSRGPEFESVGERMIEGLWNGIKSMGSWIQEKVSGFVGGIVDDVKDVLGIHSPSRVFAGIGENMALGLGEGWDNEYEGIKSNITSGLNFRTASVDFASSGIGIASAGIVNGVSDAVNRGQLSGGFTAVLQLPDNTELARYYLSSFIDVARSNGTPIANPIVG